MPFHILLFHPALTNLLLFGPVHANLFINSFCLPLTAASSFQPPPLVLVPRPPPLTQKQSRLMMESTQILNPIKKLVALGDQQHGGD